MSLNTINVADFNWQIILNPNAQDHKGLEHWNEIAAKLDEHHVRYELYQANGSHSGINLARKLCQEGQRHLMVIGGDGSINEIVNGIFTSGIDTHEVFLAVIPHGRGNDWARTHHYPTDYLEAVEGFLKGRFIEHDVGLTKVFQGEKEIEQRYFININSFGFSAEVIYETIYTKPKFLNISVYMLGVFLALFKHKPIPVIINSKDFHYQGKPFLFAVANCKYHGDGMKQAPDASFDDGVFDVIILPQVGILTVLLKIKHIFTGKHIQKIKGVQCFRTNKLSISAEPSILGELEGELLSQGRYEIEMLPLAFNTLTFIE